MAKSAINRHHIARLKNKYKHYHIVTGWADLFDLESVEAKRRIGMALQTPAPCSCPMCGNARKHFHARTIKEVSDLQYFKLELKDLGL